MDNAPNYLSSWGHYQKDRNSCDQLEMMSFRSDSLGLTFRFNGWSPRFHLLLNVLYWGFTREVEFVDLFRHFTTWKNTTKQLFSSKLHFRKLLHTTNYIVLLTCVERYPIENAPSTSPLVFSSQSSPWSAFSSINVPFSKLFFLLAKQVKSSSEVVLLGDPGKKYLFNRNCHNNM